MNVAGVFRTRCWLAAALAALASFQDVRAGADVDHAFEEGVAAKIPLLVMPIEYADCRLSIPDEDWNRKIFATPTQEEEDQRFDLFGPSGTSLNNYFREITGGRFQFEPVAENAGSTNDGVKLTQAAGVKPKYRDFPVSVGTLVHELGHAFGTPDLPFTGYLAAVGYGQKNGRVALFPGTKLEYGRGAPSHYGAYTMVNAGFVEPIVLERTGVYEVKSAGTGDYTVYKIPTKDPKEYFLLENRQPEGSDLAGGISSKSGRVGGLAIWHVNEAFGKNPDKDKQMVSLVEASEGPLGYSALKKNRNLLAVDPFYPLPGNSEFSGTSTPSNRSYRGEPQPWKITDIAPSGRVMTFRFTVLPASR